jgi:hypothetical protein
MGIDTLVTAAIAVVCIGMLVVAARILWTAPRYGWGLTTARFIGLAVIVVAVVWYAGIALTRTPRLGGLDAGGWVIYLVPGLFSGGTLAVLLQTASERQPPPG